MRQMRHERSGGKETIGRGMKGKEKKKYKKRNKKEIEKKDKDGPRVGD